MSDACEQAWMEGDEALAAHAKGCEDCRRALEAMAEPPAPPSKELLSALGTSARAELAKRPRPRRWWAAPIGVGVLNLVIAVALASGTMRAGFGPGISSVGRVGFALALVLSVAGLLLALWPARRLRELVWPLLGAVAVLVLLGGNDGLLRGRLLAGWGCGVAELEASLLPLIAAVWVLRQAAFTPWRAALACGSAVCVGLTVLCASCPNGSLVHIGVFHVLPGLLLALGGIAFRARMPSESYAP